jgi:hypothetical protein
MAMSVFGFSTEPSSGGDWLPIATYDARAGRFFRIDRSQDGSGGWDSEKVDIAFKAMVDFDNIEVGWLNFTPGQAPSIVVVPLEGITKGTSKMPDRPSELHKNGIRMVVKLAKDIGGEKPFREMASSAKAFLGGIEAAYNQYLAERAGHPGQLPVLICEKTTPITTGTGKNQSTNYAPTFKIVAWLPRGDLQPQPRGANPTQPAGGSHPSNGSGAAAPATGGQRVSPPAQQPQQTVSADDFG